MCFPKEKRGEGRRGKRGKKRKSRQRIYCRTKLTCFLQSEKVILSGKTCLDSQWEIPVPLLSSQAILQLPYGPTNGYFTCYSTNYNHIFNIHRTYTKLSFFKSLRENIIYSTYLLEENNNECRCSTAKVCKQYHQVCKLVYDFLFYLQK